jgi:hypothetical protein
MNILPSIFGYEKHEKEVVKEHPKEMQTVIEQQRVAPGESRTRTGEAELQNILYKQEMASGVPFESTEEMLSANVQQLAGKQMSGGPWEPTSEQIPEVTTREYVGAKKPIEDPTLELFNRFVANDTHCLLAKTGVKVCRITLGTMNFGKLDSKYGDRPGQLSEYEAHRILDRYVELGGNCIDTANFFPWFGSHVGKSETIIGNWLKKYLTKKFFFFQINFFD